MNGIKGLHYLDTLLLGLLGEGCGFNCNRKTWDRFLLKDSYEIVTICENKKILLSIGL